MYLINTQFCNVFNTFNMKSYIQHSMLNLVTEENPASSLYIEKVV